MQLPDLATLEATAALVHEHLGPTPQIAWPLLAERCGAEVFVKHENYLPTGAFKVRGGLAYHHDLRTREPALQGVITATRGNHGQSVAWAASRAGLPATIVIPRGNSPAKNAAMRAYGATLVEAGDDFSEADEAASRLAEERGLHRVTSFHPLLIAGVASYGLELLRGVPDLDTVYVPIGLGSGIASMIAVRDALRLRTRVVGVVSTGAAAYARSFEAGRAISTAAADTFADGIAVRVPNPEAVAIINAGADRIVEVDDSAIEAAMRHLFTDTHSVAEGAGAAALAALIREAEAMRGKRVAVIVTGGNVDRALYQKILAG